MCIPATMNSSSIVTALKKRLTNLIENRQGITKKPIYKLKLSFCKISSTLWTNRVLRWPVPINIAIAVLPDICRIKERKHTRAHSNQRNS